MTLQVRLNGTPIRGRISGLESFAVTYSRNEATQREQRAFSNELKFYDDGFNIVFNYLVASPQGLNRSIKVEIWDECCNDFIYQDLVIKGNMVDYCTGECFVTCTMTREDEEERIYKCFERTPITTDLEEPDGSFNINHWLVNAGSGITIPHIEYANNVKPGFFHDIVLLLGTLIFWLFGILGNILGAILGNNNPISQFSNAVQQIILGYGRKHPSPRIVDYIYQAANYCKCNPVQSFSSSIFTDPNSFYSSTLYFYAPIKEGKVNPPRYIIENRPRETITEFLDKVASDFNAVWWIQNGQLRMERKDWFLTAPVLFDAIANQGNGTILKGACFTYNKGTLYSSQRLTVASDTSEGCGINSEDSYSNFFDYVKIHNQPSGYESWDEIKDVRFNYAPTRFGTDQNPPSTLNRIQQGLLSWLFNLIWNPPWGHILNLPVIQKDEFAIPKYYEWDNDPATVFSAKARREFRTYTDPQTGQNTLTTSSVPNPRYVIKYQNNYSAGASNIYNDFHKIDDPIIAQGLYRFWDFEIEVKMDCQMIKGLTVNKTVRLQTPYGQTVWAKINTIVANYGDRTITITGSF